MLKIGDFSRLGCVSIKTLRYYDELGLLKPAEVDRFSGYRYYSAEQLPRLNRIIVLKNLGLTLEEISELVNNDLPAQRILQMLRVKETEIRQRLEDEHRRLSQVEEWLDRIKKEGSMPKLEITLKKIEKQKVAALRGTIPAYSDMHVIFDELCGHLIAEKAHWVGPPIAVYYDTEYRERDVDVEVAVPVSGKLRETDRIKVRDLSGIEQAACMMHKGPYEAFRESYQAAMSWFDDNGYEISGPNREVYLQGPDQGNDTSTYLTELQFPVKKK
jgi:effector-binding domain-containing protein